MKRNMKRWVGGGDVAIEMHSGTYGTELSYIRRVQVEREGAREGDKESVREGRRMEKEKTDSTCKRSFYLSTSAPWGRSVYSSAGGWCEGDRGRHSEVSSSTWTQWHQNISIFLKPSPGLFIRLSGFTLESKIAKSIYSACYDTRPRKAPNHHIWEDETSKCLLVLLEWLDYENRSFVKQRIDE